MHDRVLPGESVLQGVSAGDIHLEYAMTICNRFEAACAATLKSALEPLGWTTDCVVRIEVGDPGGDSGDRACRHAMSHEYPKCCTGSTGANTSAAH